MPHEALASLRKTAEREAECESSARRRVNRIMSTDNELIKNLDKLHTTDLGAVRIRRNLSLETEDVVSWCREKTASLCAVITRSGKNWYVDVEDIIITVNAHSYTIITAHRK